MWEIYFGTGVLIVGGVIVEIAERSWAAGTGGGLTGACGISLAADHARPSQESRLELVRQLVLVNVDGRLDVCVMRSAGSCDSQASRSLCSHSVVACIKYTRRRAFFLCRPSTSHTVRSRREMLQLASVSSVAPLGMAFSRRNLTRTGGTWHCGKRSACTLDRVSWNVHSARERACRLVA